jgi:hypothetical protein
MAVEADGSLVADSDQQVHPRGTLVAKARNQRRDQLPSEPAPLQARQQVDVQFRWEPLGYLPRGAEVMVDVMERTPLLLR